MTRFITTLLAGIAIGVLIAPDKGSATRKKITDLCSDMMEDLTDIANTGSKQSFDDGREAGPKIMGEF